MLSLAIADCRRVTGHSKAIQPKKDLAGIRLAILLHGS